MAAWPFVGRCLWGMDHDLLEFRMSVGIYSYFACIRVYPYSEDLARIDYRGTGGVGGALARTMPKVSM